MNVISSPRSLLLSECVCHPLQTVNNPVSRDDARVLDEPVPGPHVGQPQLVSHLSGAHGLGQVLLVCEHEYRRVPEPVVLEDGLQLLSGLLNPHRVVAVHDVDDALSNAATVASS